MRAYSHALLTHAAALRLSPSESVPTWAFLGAVLPDLSAAIGTAWLWARRSKAPSREEFEKDVCGRSLFRAPDAALHSALPVTTPLAALAFLLGRAGHAASDALTHATDARPPFWPVSYRERAHHASAFTAAEHLALPAISRQLSPRRG